MPADPSALLSAFQRQHAITPCFNRDFHALASNEGTQQPILAGSNSRSDALTFQPTACVLTYQPRT